jgi:hypothetical protein
MVVELAVPSGTAHDIQKIRNEFQPMQCIQTPKNLHSL